jgi:hypothetical protein
VISFHPCDCGSTGEIVFNLTPQSPNRISDFVNKTLRTRNVDLLECRKLLREHTQVAMAVATKVWLDAAAKLDGPRPGHNQRRTPRRAAERFSAAAREVSD